MSAPDLQALVSEGLVDEPLHVVTLEQVAEAWLRYHHGEPDSEWWAVELWMSLERWEDEARVRDQAGRHVTARPCGKASNRRR